MHKKIFLSGLLGAGVLLLWNIFLNVVLGFNVRFNMKPVPNEREVYSALQKNITEAGRYLCNPALTTDGQFPNNEPVFGIQYAGVGHEAAGRGVMLGLLQFLSASLLGTWMLSKTSEQYRSLFGRRVFFFFSIGLLVAIVGDLGSFGIGATPLKLALLLAARTIATWTILGLTIAPLMRPAQ